ncbi:MAG: M48 family metallopeptidase [Clostridia bacterium]|nr:M48 family metallopeptidase [Clostridia bacterium]
MIEYTLIRSNRRTVGIQIRGTEVIVRAPLFMSQRRIDDFVRENEAWAERNLQKAEKQQRKAESLGPLTEEELTELTARAKEYIPGRVAFYAPQVGVTVNRVTIRCQRTKWGSCSAAGNLNFNCLLMLCPPDVIDSVVVHELCHLIEMNHSDRFYQEVLRVFPDYKKHHAWLKRNGGVLLRRAKAGEENTEE